MAQSAFAKHAFAELKGSSLLTEAQWVSVDSGLVSSLEVHGDDDDYGDRTAVWPILCSMLHWRSAAMFGNTPFYEGLHTSVEAGIEAVLCSAMFLALDAFHTKALGSGETRGKWNQSAR